MNDISKVIEELRERIEWCDKFYTASEFESEFSDDESAYIALAAAHMPAILAAYEAAVADGAALRQGLAALREELEAARAVIDAYNAIGSVLGYPPPNHITEEQGETLLTKHKEFAEKAHDYLARYPKEGREGK